MNDFLKSFFVVIFSIFCNFAFAGWTGRWDSKGADAIIMLTSDPNNLDFAKNSLLVIGYSKKFDCQPVVSVLVMKGQKLGQPIDQLTSKSKKNQIIIAVGSKIFTEETKMTKYTNGIEFAMRGSNDLVNALTNENIPFSATIGSTKLLEFSNASGFEKANRNARIKCS